MAAPTSQHEVTARKLSDTISGLWGKIKDTFQTKLTGQTAYSAKGTATKVPQITTNALGQVTGITEVDISGVPPKSHTHGNIQNGGTLQTNDITIASGDKLVVTDSSDSSKVARASVSFDGSTTTKALTQKGTFESFAKSGDITTAIQALDVSSVGGAGKYISAISETDGKISATATTMDTSPTASSTNAVTSGGVKSALDGKSATSHTHSVKVNGETKTIAASGGTAVDLGTFKNFNYAKVYAVAEYNASSARYFLLAERETTYTSNWQDTSEFKLTAYSGSAVPYYMVFRLGFSGTSSTCNTPKVYELYSGNFSSDGRKVIEVRYTTSVAASGITVHTYIYIDRNYLQTRWTSFLLEPLSVGTGDRSSVIDNGLSCWSYKDTETYVTSLSGTSVAHSSETLLANISGNAATADGIRKYSLGVSGSKPWRKVLSVTGLDKWSSAAVVLRVFNRGYSITNNLATYYGTVVFRIYRGEDSDAYPTYRDLFVDNGMYADPSAKGWNACIVWTSTNDAELWLHCSVNSSSVSYEVEYSYNCTVGDPIGNALSTSEMTAYLNGKSYKNPTYSVAYDGTYPSMTVGNASNANYAATAGIATELRYAYVNKSSQTTKVWKKIATSKTFTSWDSCSICFLYNHSGYINELGLDSIVSVSIRTGNAGSFAAARIDTYSYRSASETQLLRIGSTNQYEVWVKVSTTDTNMCATVLNTYGGWTINTNTSQTGQLTDDEFTTYKASNPAVGTAYNYNMAKASKSGVGSSFVPVYVDQYGTLKACDLESYYATQQAMATHENRLGTIEARYASSVTRFDDRINTAVNNGTELYMPSIGLKIRLQAQSVSGTNRWTLFFSGDDSGLALDGTVNYLSERSQNWQNVANETYGIRAYTVPKYSTWGAVDNTYLRDFAANTTDEYALQVRLHFHYNGYVGVYEASVHKPSGTTSTGSTTRGYGTFSCWYRADSYVS